jgi:dCMP deaminase
MNGGGVMGINYLEVAKCIASVSKDPKYKIGAVIFDRDENIVSIGYNGAPRQVADKPERYEKPLKQFYIAHAEENAIAQAARKGHPTEGCVMLIWGKTPCANCTRMIIQAGIKSVMFIAEDIRLSSYFESFKASLTMLQEAGILITYMKGE